VKWISQRRPSPALIVALIALFVSLSGVSYGVATGFIDSREIKNNEVRSLDLRNNEVRTIDLRNNHVRGIDIRNSSVQGRDIGLNTVTGLDVNESTLGKVPSATSADSASTAGFATSAGSVGGFSNEKLTWSGEIGATDFEQFATVGGLSLEARCENAGGPSVVVQARTSLANSEIGTHFRTFSNANLDFDPGEVFIVDDHVDGPGQVVFAAPNGQVITIEALAREDADDVRGSSDDCGFFGIARSG
jgi:hypothetical protein